MIIRVMRFCAHLSESTAEKAIAYAGKYVNNKEGLVLASSADLFLGDLGAVSKKKPKAFPFLEQSMENLLTNEQDWLLEAILRYFRIWVKRKR
jgi:hypothetical protein